MQFILQHRDVQHQLCMVIAVLAVFIFKKYFTSLKGLGPFKNQNITKNSVYIVGRLGADHTEHNFPF